MVFIFSVVTSNVSQSFDQSFTSNSSDSIAGTPAVSQTSSVGSMMSSSVVNNNVLPSASMNVTSAIESGMGQQSQEQLPPYVEERVEPVNGIVQPPVIPPPNKPHRNSTQLQFVLKTMNRYLMRHNYAWPFHTPVDAIKLNLPDYHKIITRPMDLGTIKKRLENCWYNSVQECIDDFDLMFNNCYTYNKDGEDVVLMARTLHNLLKEKLEQMPKEDIELPLPAKNHKGKSKNKNKGGGGFKSAHKSECFFVF